jgi:hypothetical protein
MRKKGRSAVAGKKSRNKGASFERLIANAFSEAYGSRFTRTPGWAQDSGITPGDIMCRNPANDPGFCVECKKAEGWQLESLLTDNHAWFDAYWEQTLGECPDDRVPLLVFSRNRMPVFLAADYDTLWGCPGAHLTFMLGEQRITVITLESFLAWDTGANE